MCDTHRSEIHINIRGKYISHLGGSVCHNCLDIRLRKEKCKKFWPCTSLALISEEKDGCLQHSCVVLHTFQNSKNMVGQNTLPNQIDHHCATVRTFDSEMNISVNNVSAGHALGIWICGCGLFYKRELWASKSAGAKRWCPKDLWVHAPCCTCANAFPEVSLLLW